MKQAIVSSYALLCVGVGVACTGGADVASGPPTSTGNPQTTIDASRGGTGGSGAGGFRPDPLEVDSSAAGASASQDGSAGTSAESGQLDDGGAGPADAVGDAEAGGDAGKLDAGKVDAGKLDDSGPGANTAGSADAIYSGVPWFDTEGNLVNAHGPGFLKVGSTYYMVGEQRSGANDTYTGALINGEDSFTGISMYSTTDFANWTFVGTVVKPITGTIVAPPYYGERPKILYNASTSKYIIYIKMLKYVGNPAVYTGYYAVLTSSNVAGPYAYQGNLSSSGADDFQVFQDDDGAQYLVRSSGDLYKFSANGLSLTGQVANAIQSGEGVSLYKAGSSYFWQSSQGTYWYSNDNSYSTASSLTGPWTSRGHFCPTGTKTWQSQDTAVVPIKGSVGTTYVYGGDRWTNGDLPSSTLVVQPLTVTGSTESIPVYNPVWHLDVNAGTWSSVTPSGTSVNDSVTGTGPNQFNYASGWTSVTSNGASGGDLHASSTSGATATLAFSGRQILLYSAYDANSGIMGVTLLDKNGMTLRAEAHVSLRYDAAPAGNYLVYASPTMPSGSYQLKVRVTGKKDLYSNGTSVNIDRVVVVGE